jgi:hypothetical protein
MFSYLSQMVCAVFDLCTPSWSWHTCPDIGTSSIDWVQLSRFYLKTDKQAKHSRHHQLELCLDCISVLVLAQVSGDRD